MNDYDDAEPNSLQGLINSGTVWRLEGAAGRTAMAAIHAGHCVLPTVRHRDYYGNTVPSRIDLEEGSHGTLSYALLRHDPDECEFCEEDQ